MHNESHLFLSDSLETDHLKPANGTHWHEAKQLENRPYAPLIVLEPGQEFDPEHDRSFVFYNGRYAPFPEVLLVNGAPEPDPWN